MTPEPSELPERWLELAAETAKPQTAIGIFFSLRILLDRLRRAEETHL